MSLINLNSEEKMRKADESDGGIEYILNDIGGSFRKFQIWNYIIISIPICLSGIFGLNYVFTSLNLEYRCYIPECENLDHINYNADWVSSGIPHVKSTPMKCHRYQPIMENHNSSHYINDRTTDLDTQICSKDFFNRSFIVKCDQDGLIYKTKEVTLLNEFNLTCEENEWKLAMVGAYSNIAKFMFMPLGGILSDRFGRKFLLIIGICGSSLVGLIQSFSTSYIMFVILEFVQSAFSCSMYPAALLLGLEWASVQHRVLVTCLIIFMYPFGQAICGLIALYAQHFRVLMRIVYGPGFIVALILIFFAPESLRWLLSKGKQDHVHRLLSKAARINKLHISQKSLDIVDEKCESIKAMRKKVSSEDGTTNQENSLKTLFTSRTLIFRFIVITFCWVTIAYVSYGVSITSVFLHGNKYVSFIIVSIGGAPSGFLTFFLLKYLGRPKTIFLSLSITGISIITAKILPEEYSTLALILYLTGRCFSSHAFDCIYIYTIELWPTPLRHSLMGFNSTIGRIGAILAPLSPLLGHFFSLLPYLSFGVMSISAGLLVLFLPETLGNELPDTLEQAKNIGKKK